MGRGWKIAFGAVLALIVLLAVNTLIVDGDTDAATVTVPGGRILDLPQGQVQVVDEGPRDGYPIVLIHCFSCAIDWWDGVRAKVSPERRVVAVDLRGHGGSEKPASGYSVPEQAQLVAAALGRLGVEDAEVVGHSLGGAVSVALAEAAPAAVDRVAIVDMPPDDSYGGLGFIAGLAFQPVLGEALWTIKPDLSVRQGLGVAFAPGFDVPDAFVADVNRMTYTAYDESPTETDDFLDQLPLDLRMRRTGKPLLVLMGEEEQIVTEPQRALDQYAGTVPATRARLIPGAGHSPNVERPALTARLIEEFANPHRSGVRSPG